MDLQATGQGGRSAYAGGTAMIAPFTEFRAKKVLVVESEFLFPSQLYREIERAGGEVLGPVGFIDDVVLLVEDSRPDVAIVDTRLRGDEREAVCGLLRRVGVPIVEPYRGMESGRMRRLWPSDLPWDSSALRAELCA